MFFALSKMTPLFFAYIDQKCVQFFQPCQFVSDFLSRAKLSVTFWQAWLTYFNIALRSHTIDCNASQENPTSYSNWHFEMRHSPGRDATIYAFWIQQKNLGQQRRKNPLPIANDQ